MFSEPQTLFLLANVLVTPLESPNAVVEQTIGFSDSGDV